MTSFVWSGGHIGWPLFGIVVFTMLAILAADLVWRVVRIPIRRLLACAAAIWIAGIVGLIVSFRLWG